MMGNKIISDFAALMERNPPVPTRIEDTSVLPHPKEAILEALYSALTRERDLSRC